MKLRQSLCLFTLAILTTIFSDITVELKTIRFLWWTITVPVPTLKKVKWTERLLDKIALWDPNRFDGSGDFKIFWLDAFDGATKNIVMYRVVRK